MPDQPNDEVISRLDKLIRLVATGLAIGKSQAEQVGLLSQAGLQPKEIADILGTTPNTVRVTLSTARKQNKKKGKKNE
ncbi:MAG: sigma factor-like helix-turn-helix DNA-binding protein [Sedimentisphaerales bacterium]|jgi:DNA-binding CsgD family transcriptional regulator